MKIVQILPFPPDFFRFRGGFSASEWRGMLPAACFVCAERTVRYAAPPPPLRGPYLFCAGMAWDASGGSFFCTNRCGMPPAAYFFLARQKKVCKKETPENEIALTRLKSLSFCLAFCRFVSVVKTPFGRPSNRVSQAHDRPCKSLFLRPLNI